MIDIVIPVLNEETVLNRDKEYLRALAARARLFFVDGGSTDGTRELAGQIASVSRGPRGRALQKNTGAGEGDGDILVFLHADTRINPADLDQVSRAVEGGAAAGCFTAGIREPRPVFRLFEYLLNQRAGRCGVFDGDMGMFVRRDVFEALGGFPDFPVMEDIILSRRLRQRGRLVRLPSGISISARKWRAEGFFRTLSRYTAAYFWYWFIFPFIQHEQR